MSTSQPSEVTIQGQYYTGKNSSRRNAVLRSVGGVVVLDAEGTRLPLSWQDLTISPRIGNTPRYLYLPDDGVFETTDNDGVDRLSRQTRSGALQRLVHRLESHLGLILVAIVVTIATTGFAFVYGVPWTAKVVAHALPNSIAAQLGETTLTSLDSTWLEPSTLEPERQQQLLEHFRPYLEPVNGQELNVLFRSSPAVGANAMALPDGTLIFTDELVNLARDDDELVAILAHEIGHVAHRHGLQGVVQSSLAFWLVVMMTGDLSAFSDATVGVPAVLMSLAYSRDMERQADTYALETLKKHNIEPAHFANIMIRLMSEDEEQADAEHEEEEDSRWSQVGELLSTHPVTKERIERFQQP